MPEGLLNFISSYGDVAVALIVLIEGLGIPLPGETAVLVGAALAGQGDISLARVMVGAFVGAILGGSGGYWIGRLGGMALLHRHGSRVWLTQQRIGRAGDLLDRHGAAAIIIARFIAFIRILISYVAGAAQMPFWRFFVFNAIGALAWVGVLGPLGYAFGNDLPRLERWIRNVGVGFVSLVVIAAVVVPLVFWLRRRHRGPDE
jgi:membrane protein DedA with SNARE-associated domain